MINTTGKLASFCTFLSPLAPSLRIHWPQFSRHSPLATRHYLLRPSPTGYCLTPTVDLSKTEQGPISTNGPSILSMSPNKAIPAEKSNRSSLLAAVGPLAILSWPEALNASRSRRACRMAQCLFSACSP